MLTLGAARLISAEGSRAVLALDRGFSLVLFFLDRYLVRLVIVRPEGLRMPRTWSLSPELSGCDPLGGRDRFDLRNFPGSEILSVAETAAAITIETALVKAEIRRSPLAITWFFRADEKAAFQPALQDRQTQAYFFDRGGPSFAHYLVRDASEHYYGFGEKSGDANKHGRRLRMGTTDALGYDAATSDPLYKHIPFYITLRPGSGSPAVGLFYDNLSRGAFDLGQEIDYYHKLYRSFEASDGDLDLYVMFGRALSDVVTGYTALTGRTAFPPRWSLSYSGSTMKYTDAPDAEAELYGFLARLQENGIACQSFHLSSGYTMQGDKRYVFTWDRSRFPDPAALCRRFAEGGVRLIANIKPAMLLDHPLIAEVEAFRGFVRDSENESRPAVAQFWPGDAAFLDFTNPQTSAWWARAVKAQLLGFGIAATWNDNNEFEIWDDRARVDLDGRGGAMACLRPVQTGLMLRASTAAQRERAPSKRPFLVSRSGGPGMQRYAQTWTGDNLTDWKTLRYNLRMGHGLSLSGVFNFGHDVGGFAGPSPSPELFMRWIEQGVYWPRFSIHSWKDDGSVNEPWMYPEMLPAVRKAISWRERLTPLLYTLMWRAHAHHEPVLRPLFYDFPEEAESYRENDAFMLGRDLLVAPVVEPGAAARSVRLPKTDVGWFDIRTGARVASGEVHVEAPLGAAPAFMRAGAILPLGPSPSWSDGPLTLRLFPLEDGRSELEIYDDDGESVVDRANPLCLIHVTADWNASVPSLTVSKQGEYEPRWAEIRFENASGQPFAVTVNGDAFLSESYALHGSTTSMPK
jgi:alpha-glucosidase